MPLESRVDVLIIGAGPAGIMCANALAVAGTNVRIIDKRYGSCSTIIVSNERVLIGPSPAKVAVGQADGIQTRTIEVLQACRSPHLSLRLELCNRAMDSQSVCFEREIRCTWVYVNVCLLTDFACLTGVMPPGFLQPWS